METSLNYGNRQTSSQLKHYLVLLIVLCLFLLCTNNVFATIVQRGTATSAAVTNNSSLTVTKPTGVVSGDVMIASLAQVNSLTAPTAPARSEERRVGKEC
jgi:hypothetical protein